MLSEFIRSVHSYSALPLAGTADRPETRSTWSSRTKVKSPQNSTPAVDRRPTCLTLDITNYSVQWTIAYSKINFEMLVFSLYGHIFLQKYFPRYCPFQDSTDINQLDHHIL